MDVDEIAEYRSSKEGQNDDLRRKEMDTLKGISRKFKERSGSTMGSEWRIRDEALIWAFPEKRKLGDQVPMCRARVTQKMEEYTNLRKRFY